MRIRRIIVGRVALTVGNVGTLVLGPVLIIATAMAPVGAPAAVAVTPSMVIAHG